MKGVALFEKIIGLTDKSKNPELANNFYFISLHEFKIKITKATSTAVDKDYYYKVGSTGSWQSTTTDDYFETIVTSTYITVPASTKIYFKTADNNFSNLTGTSEDLGVYLFNLSSDYHDVKVKGNILKLKNDGNNNVIQPGEFMYLFYSCEDLIDASDVLIPSVGLAQHCFADMFHNCSRLTAVPDLPAKELSIGCYQQMFQSCIALSTVPRNLLPATKLSQQCYSFMFCNCISLTSAPILPANKLASYCYMGMFEVCTGLVTPPALPANVLYTGCYSTMFYDCYSLSTTPRLSTTHLAPLCYDFMFAGCSSLTTPPQLPALKTAPSCYYGMFMDCTSLTSAPDLPAEVVLDASYNMMFMYCTSLTTTPNISGKFIMDDGCGGMFYCCSGIEDINMDNIKYIGVFGCEEMFAHCWSLTNIPSDLFNLHEQINLFPASCCYLMFYNCSGLTDIEDLTIGTTGSLLQENCFEGMFERCTAIEKPPQLPPFTLAPSCYMGMFSGCTSLTSSPLLKAQGANLANNCYNYMFTNCTSLILISAALDKWAFDANAVSTSPEGWYTYSWVQGVNTINGTFHCAPELSGALLANSKDKIPIYWKDGNNIPNAPTGLTGLPDPIIRDDIPPVWNIPDFPTIPDDPDDIGDEDDPYNHIIINDGDDPIEEIDPNTIVEIIAKVIPPEDGGDVPTSVIIPVDWDKFVYPDPDDDEDDTTPGPIFGDGEDGNDPDEKKIDPDTGEEDDDGNNGNTSGTIQQIIEEIIKQNGGGGGGGRGGDTRSKTQDRLTRNKRARLKFLQNTLNIPKLTQGTNPGNQIGDFVFTISQPKTEALLNKALLKDKEWEPSDDIRSRIRDVKPGGEYVNGTFYVPLKDGPNGTKVQYKVYELLRNGVVISQAILLYIIGPIKTITDFRNNGLTIGLTSEERTLQIENPRKLKLYIYVGGRLHSSGMLGMEIKKYEYMTDQKFILIDLKKYDTTAQLHSDDPGTPGEIINVHTSQLVKIKNLDYKLNTSNPDYMHNNLHFRSANGRFFISGLLNSMSGEAWKPSWDNKTESYYYNPVPTYTYNQGMYYGLFSNWTALDLIHLMTLPPAYEPTYTDLKLFRGGLTEAQLKRTLPNYYCAGLFSGCTNLTAFTERWSNVFTTSQPGDYACYNMFRNCGSLVTVPSQKLDIKSINECTFKNMFKNCSSLTVMPLSVCLDSNPNVGDIFADDYPNSRGSGAFESMFENCTSLTNGNNLMYIKVDGQSNSYYQNILQPAHFEEFKKMFANCTSLIVAPHLSGTRANINKSAYEEMFRGCNSLGTGFPFETFLSGKNVGEDAFRHTFSGCTSLKTDIDNVLDLAYFFSLNCCCFAGRVGYPDYSTWTTESSTDSNGNVIFTKSNPGWVKIENATNINDSDCGIKINGVPLFKFAAYQCGNIWLLPFRPNEQIAITCARAAVKVQTCGVLGGAIGYPNYAALSENGTGATTVQRNVQFTAPSNGWLRVSIISLPTEDDFILRITHPNKSPVNFKLYSRLSSDSPGTTFLLPLYSGTSVFYYALGDVDIKFAACNGGSLGYPDYQYLRDDSTELLNNTYINDDGWVRITVYNGSCTRISFCGSNWEYSLPLYAAKANSNNCGITYFYPVQARTTVKYHTTAGAGSVVMRYVKANSSGGTATNIAPIINTLSHMTFASVTEHAFYGMFANCISIKVPPIMSCSGTVYSNACSYMYTGTAATLNTVIDITPSANLETNSYYNFLGSSPNFSSRSRDIQFIASKNTLNFGSNYTRVKQYKLIELRYDINE